MVDIVVGSTFRNVGILTGSIVVLAAAALVPTQIKPTPFSTPPKNEGEKLFEKRCAPCHGKGGQGGPGYRNALHGTLSNKELTGYIKKSMPPMGPKCPSPDADKIAAYMFDAFYSPLAQERIRPLRVELARLTARQFRNAVSDLVSGFHPAVPNTQTHGLLADYFKSRSRDQKNKAFTRTDPDINFDFGTEAPSKEGFDSHNFSIYWQGSVVAPDSGEYEFGIHSRHACQMWLNDSRYPLVDGEVRSAGDADPHGTITLLGGRAYSIRVVFTKATQGVDDPKKKDQKKSEPAFVTLRWRRPNHADEPIPTQFLYPETTPKSFVVTTPFPPDDRSTGYERGDAVSKEWDDATTAAALEAADYVSKNLREVTGVPDDAKDRDARLTSFCQNFVQRAFRRPLTDPLKQTYITHQFRVASTLENAVKRVVLLSLKSPRFLYREIGEQNGDPYTIASQLAFGLWDTLPDRALEDAAARGKLSTTDEVKFQARRMITDGRAWNKLRQFLLLWLKVDEVPDITKNPKHYPGFDASVVSDLRTSLELFLANNAWGDTANFRDLMLSNKAFLNGRLANLYGVNLPANAPFQEVNLDPDRRAGLITQPYLLARFAYLDGSSPIHRGVLIERNFLGRTLSPPPANFAPLSAAAQPKMTTRERVAMQTKPTFCNNCHGIINPLGFTLEKFDAIGRLREVENGRPIDDSGFYKSRKGVLVKFMGAKDLANYLATSEDSRQAFVEKLFLNVAKQPPRAFGPRILPDLEQSFQENEYSIRSLLINMVTSVAMPTKKMPLTKRTAKL